MPMMFFYFLKIIFDISTLKQFKTYKSYLILIKKIKIFKNTAAAAFSNIFLVLEWTLLGNNIY
jgi:hypothetical protein